MWTVIQLIQKTADFLGERGSPSPRIDAEVLLAHSLGDRDRTWLYMNAQRPVSDDELEAYRALVGRRARGEPVAYIIGTAGFWTLDLGVDPRVLIPRPETERIVELTMDALSGLERSDWRIVDVGTGSGALALALASEFPEATVLATDRSADALEVARANADATSLRERVRFARGDLLEPLAGREDAVDVIVSNPPYVADDDPDLAANVRAHEPAAALFAGVDGLEVIRRLIPQAYRALVPGGLLLVEFGAKQGLDVLALARSTFEEAHIERDHARLDRVLVARKAGVLSPARPTPPEAETTEPEGAYAAGDEEAPSADPDAGEASSPQQRMLEEARAEGVPIIELDEL